MGSNYRDGTPARAGDAIIYDPDHASAPYAYGGFWGSQGMDRWLDANQQTHTFIVGMTGRVLSPNPRVGFDLEMSTLSGSTFMGMPMEPFRKYNGGPSASPVVPVTSAPPTATFKYQVGQRVAYDFAALGADYYSYDARDLAGAPLGCQVLVAKDAAAQLYLMKQFLRSTVEFATVPVGGVIQDARNDGSRNKYLVLFNGCKNLATVTELYLKPDGTPLGPPVAGARPKQLRPCTCAMTQLMRAGCACGSVTKYRPPSLA